MNDASKLQLRKFEERQAALNSRIKRKHSLSHNECTVPSFESETPIMSFAAIFTTRNKSSYQT